MDVVNLITRPPDPSAHLAQSTLQLHTCTPEFFSCTPEISSKTATLCSLDEKKYSDCVDVLDQLEDVFVLAVIQQSRLDHIYPYRIVEWHTQRSFFKVM